MSDNTKIEWTDATWNPLVGCSRVSDGCTNCYAEGIAYRFREQQNTAFFGTARRVNGHPVWTGQVNLNKRALLQPWGWTRGRRIFVNSMSDLFHESVPFETIALIFFLMSVTTRHTYQVLTKRPRRAMEFFLWALNKGMRNCGDKDPPETDLADAERMWGDLPRNWMDDAISDSMHHPLLKELSWDWVTRDIKGGTWGYDNCGPGWPYENIWIGVSVENQNAANERIPLLRKLPAAKRFLSCEPLLGPIDLEYVVETHSSTVITDNCLQHTDELNRGVRKPRIDWVIAGGESGRGARPMHPDWTRSLRNQCEDNNVPFFFKQWGEYASVSEVAGDGSHHYFSDGATVRRVGKKAAGRILDGRVHDEFPATT